MTSGHSPASTARAPTASTRAGSTSESWSWGETQPVQGAGRDRRGRREGPASRTSSSASRVSKASPKLFLACASGQHVKEAKLVGRRGRGKAVQDFLTWTFTVVLVAGYQTGWRGQRGGCRGPSVSLNFGKVTVATSAQKADGSLDTPVTAGWERRDQQEGLTAYDRFRTRATRSRRRTPTASPTGSLTLFGLRAGVTRRRAGCSSSAAGTAATSCRWPTRCPAAACCRRRPLGACDRAGARGAARRALGLAQPPSCTGPTWASLARARHVRLRGRARRLLVDRRRRRATRCSPPAASTWRPDGVAYVSYDVLPGGHLREITRQMLRWHLRAVDEPEQRIAQARALLAAIVEAAPGGRRDAPRRPARVAAGGPVDLPRRARATPRGGAVHRLRRPRGRARPAVPGRGRRVRDGGRRPARRASPRTRSSASSTSTSSRAGCSGRRCCATTGAELRAGGLEVVRGMLAATPARPVDES